MSRRLKNFLDDVKLLGWRFAIEGIWDAMYGPIRRTFANFKRLWDYLPIIWQDRDWDHGYFLTMMQFKLSRMEKALLNGSSVVHKHLKRDMRTMVALLTKLNDPHESYYEPTMKAHNAKWGEIKWNWGSAIKGPDGSTYKTSLLSRPNARTPEEVEQERKEWRVLIKHETYLHQQDLDLLFKLLRKRIESMWD